MMSPAHEFPDVTKAPLYNSRIISSYIKFTKSNYGYVNISELLEHAGMEPYQVEDEGHWFTQDQVDRFYERLVKATNNRNIAREAGRYAASPETSGLLRQYVLGFVGPAKVYEMIGKATPNFTRSSLYEAKKLGSNRIEITVTPIDGVEERPFQCENRMGYFEAIATVFNYKLPKIEHNECMFKGAGICRYTITWQELRSSFWKRVRNYTALALILTLLPLFIMNHGLIHTGVIPLGLALVLLLTIIVSYKEAKELTDAIDNLRYSNDKLFEKINENYNNAIMINEIGLALSRWSDITSILTQVVSILKKRLDYDRGMILLTNEEKTRIYFRAGFGYSEDQLQILRNTSFHLDKAESRGVLVLSFREQKPFLINDVNEIKQDLSERSIDFVRAMGTKSFICCPIVFMDESIGILAVDNVQTKRPLLQSDLNLLMGIAPEIGISIHNAMLLEARERQFASILRVLASSIDARDPLTAGHSEKVTKYAVGICHELDMPKDYCEMIRVAGLLHDYGKIGIKDDILKKSGSLTDEEYTIIKTHVVKTREILEKVNFEGIYKEVPVIVECHHEKVDGTGYPRGLRGKDIPLGSRVLAVADVFDALTSQRHYRDPMPYEEAVALIRKSSGTHFDPDIVEAFLRYYERELRLAHEWTFRSAVSERAFAR